MAFGNRYWIELLNAHDSWVTDASMLGVIPEDQREFDSASKWPLQRALAFLHNNVSGLRSNYDLLEAGESMDVDLLNPILDSIRLRFTDWRSHPDFDDARRESLKRGERLQYLHPGKYQEGWNQGTAHIRFLVHRAAFHFSRYADLRLSDPSYPGCSDGMLRVTPCADARCPNLVEGIGNEPALCARCINS